LNRIGIAVLLLILPTAPVLAGSPAANAIDALQLMAWLASPDPPQVIDVRGRQAYRSGSLPGAFDAGSDPMGYLPDRNGDPVVLLAAQTLEPERLAAWTARLADAGHPVWLLTGGLAAWIEGGGAIEQPGASYTQPGRVPFLIPRGLCEGGEPAQVFE